VCGREHTGRAGGGGRATAGRLAYETGVCSSPISLSSTSLSHTSSRGRKRLKGGGRRDDDISGHELVMNRSLRGLPLRLSGLGVGGTGTRAEAAVARGFGGRMISSGTNNAHEASSARILDNNKTNCCKCSSTPMQAPGGCVALPATWSFWCSTCRWPSCCHTHTSRRRPQMGDAVRACRPSPPGFSLRKSACILSQAVSILLNVHPPSVVTLAICKP
jgi:hypothetical protein